MYDTNIVLRAAREQITDFQTECERQFGVDAVLKPADLIDTGKFLVKTEYAAIAVDPAHSCQYGLQIPVAYNTIEKSSYQQEFSKTTNSWRSLRR